jgi:teichuronic acid biosynthesis glycosyltransferase TuaG
VTSSPQVSVIISVYNVAPYIRQTLESVLTQTYRDLEVLVIDDCSTDASRDIVRAVAQQDSRVRLIESEVNTGPAVARNRGIEQARGRYIAFLDGDDLWYPAKLEKQLALMQSTGAVFCYTSYCITDEEGRPLSVYEVPASVGYSQLLRTNVISCSTAIYDTQKFGKVYMPLIRKRQDLALWLQLTRGDLLAYGVQEPLATYRLRNNSLSRNKLSAAWHTWKLYRDVEKLPLGYSIRCFVEYALRGVLKYYC